MPLETASTIADLVSTNPVGASDTPAALDDHIRLIKTVLKADALVEADIGVNVASQSHNHTGVYAPVGVITSSGLTQSTSRLLGRTTASTGAIEEITVGTGLSLSAGALTSTVSTTAASQSEMENASSNTVFATPSNTKWHPGIAKAYVYFDGAGTVLASHGVSGVVRNGTGDYTISFSVTFSNAYYSASFMGDADGGSYDRFGVAAVRAATTTTCRVMVGSVGTASAVPQDRGMRCVFFGDLA